MWYIIYDILYMIYYTSYIRPPFPNPPLLITRTEHKISNSMYIHVMIYTILYIAYRVRCNIYILMYNIQ